MSADKRGKLIKSGQCYALNKLVGAVAKTRDARLYVISRLIGRNVLTTLDVLRREWSAVRNEAYPHWAEDDWTVGEGFMQKMYRLHDEFQEKVLGQMRLF